MQYALLQYNETVFEPDFGLLTPYIVEYQIHYFFKRGLSSVSYAYIQLSCKVHRVGWIYLISMLCKICEANL